MNISHRLWLCIAVLLSSAAELSAKEAQQPPSPEEARQLSLVPPASYPGLPASVVDGLLASGCQIPQSYLRNDVHNVISGEFIQIGQIDWAALCMKNRKTSVLVFPGGAAPPLLVAGPWEENVHVEKIGKNRWWFGFNNLIGAVGAKTIQRYYQAY